MATLGSLRRQLAIPDWLRRTNLGVKKIELPEPAFDVKVGQAHSYNELLTGNDIAVWTARQMVEEAKARGRLLIAGPGGSSKTVVLYRCAKRVADEGACPILLSLKLWGTEHASEWNKLESRLSRIDYLLRSFSPSRVGIAELDLLDPEIPRLVILDGLNEIEGKTGQEIVLSLDEYAATAVNTSVIVSDRLVRREFIRPERWALCFVKPLSSDEVDKQIQKSQKKSINHELTEDDRQLLTSPYFLNSFLQTGVVAETRAGELQKWFLDHAGLTTEELELASKAAFEVYGGASRTFALADFWKIAGEAVAVKLRESGALQDREGLAAFDHHLKHDFLASHYVARNSDTWSRIHFDRLTFKASSFDAIMLALEQIGADSADVFIRKVYDWNIYGVGYALAEGRKHNVSAEMRTVILAMFAERKWDRVLPSAERAQDTLRILRDPNARKFRETKRLEEVFQLVQQEGGKAAWFNDWKSLFTIMPGSRIDDAQLKEIEDTDSVQGWTTANVLKRCKLNEEQLERLRALCASEKPEIKWRAAHSLGSFPSHQNVQALIRLLADQTWTVRYGSTRSLFELASRSPDDLRQEVFKEMNVHYPMFSDDPIIKDEIRRTMLIPSALNSRSWVSTFVKFISVIQQGEQEPEREKWARAAQAMFNLFDSRS